MEIEHFDTGNSKRNLEDLRLPIRDIAIFRRSRVFKSDGVVYFHFPDDRKIEIQFSKMDKISDLKGRINDKKLQISRFHFVSNSGILTDDMDVSTAGLSNGDHIIAIRKDARKRTPQIT